MGFFVDHMVCEISGEHKLAINTSIEECSDTCERPETNTVQKSCCDYASFYFQEDIPAPATETKTKQLASAFAFIPLHEVFTDFDCTESYSLRNFEEPDIEPSVKRHILFETYLI